MELDVGVPLVQGNFGSEAESSGTCQSLAGNHRLIISGRFLCSKPGQWKRMLALTQDQLIEAIGYLYEALEALESVGKEIEGGAMRGILISEKLAEAWLKVNCCRLHTQEDVKLEDLTLEAMGLINDAKCMMESLVKWKKGMTRQGKLCIMDSIFSAAENLFLVSCELEEWLKQVTE